MPTPNVPRARRRIDGLLAEASILRTQIGSAKDRMVEDCTNGAALACEVLLAAKSDTVVWMEFTREVGDESGRSFSAKVVHHAFRYSGDDLKLSGLLRNGMELMGSTVEIFTREFTGGLNASRDAIKHWIKKQHGIEALHAKWLAIRAAQGRLTADEAKKKVEREKQFNQWLADKKLAEEAHAAGLSVEDYIAEMQRRDREEARAEREAEHRARLVEIWSNGQKADVHIEGGIYVHLNGETRKACEEDVDRMLDTPTLAELETEE